MGKSYNLTPQKIEKVNTSYRRIKTKFPVPKSLAILNKLRRYEPLSMSGQPLIVWDKASKFQVYDKFGNRWIDFSSGVLVANSGHSNKEICKAIVKQVNKGLLHNYCFPSEIRAELVEKLIEITPKKLNKVFLLTTGSETIECAIKIGRTYGQKIGGKDKIGILSFTGAFHGRTLGAQMIGGIPILKEWIVNLDPNIYIVPFPNCFRCPWGKKEENNCEENCFEYFDNYLKKLSIIPQSLALIITESYQGGGAVFLPKKFVQKLREFCDKYQIVFAMDEIQAGFGRTGKMFGFEHYEIIPDLICCGKGISSSLPLSAIIGKKEIMDIYPPGEMTSTHTGNPICCAASLANLNFIQKEKLVKHCAKVGKIMEQELKKLQEKYRDFIGRIDGKGLVYGLQIVKPNTYEPDGKLAFKIVEKAITKGVLLFSPVGLGGATIKIAPPLVITELAILDGIKGLEESLLSLHLK